METTQRKKSIRQAMAESETIRMFKNPLLEKLSHVHPATPFVIYIPVVAILLFFSAQSLLWLDLVAALKARD